MESISNYSINLGKYNLPELQDVFVHKYPENAENINSNFLKNETTKIVISPPIVNEVKEVKDDKINSKIVLSSLSDHLPINKNLQNTRNEHQLEPIDKLPSKQTKEIKNINLIRVKIPELPIIADNPNENDKTECIINNFNFNFIVIEKLKEATLKLKKLNEKSKMRLRNNIKEGK